MRLRGSRLVGPMGCVEWRCQSWHAPQTAIGSSQLGKFVYVAADGKVDQRLVTLGPTDGSLVAVFNGVAEGDQIIIGNLQKIGPGSPVQPIPATTPGS